MAQVGCGSVGLIFPCATTTATTNSAPTTPNRIFRICASKRSVTAPPALPALPALLRSRPEHALRGRRHGAETSVTELLYPRAGVRLGRVQVALRVGIKVVDAAELPRLPSAIAEARHHFKRAAQDDVDLLVHAIGHVDERLLRIARAGHVPDR